MSGQATCLSHWNHIIAQIENAEKEKADIIFKRIYVRRLI